MTVPICGYNISLKCAYQNWFTHILVNCWGCEKIQKKLLQINTMKPFEPQATKYFMKSIKIGYTVA